MAKHFPLTPPPELVQEWLSEFYDFPTAPVRALWTHVANRAAQWGYQQHEKTLLDAMHSTKLPPS